MTTTVQFTGLPVVSTAQLTDIICAVQGASGSEPGTSVQETLQQVYNLMQSQVVLYYAGNPNGNLPGMTYQFCWDTIDSLLYICTASGPASSAVWTSVSIGVVTPVEVIDGGTGLTAATPYSVLCGGATSTSHLQYVSGPGSSGQVLTSNGNSALPTFQDLPPGEFGQVTVQTITGTGPFTYTPTSGTTYAVFELIGGGGGSGGASNTNGATGGGASGGYLKIVVSGSANLTNITGSVGTAGTAGGSGGNGVTGGNTTLTINSGTQWIAAGGGASLGVAGGAGAGGVVAANTVGTNATTFINIRGQNGSKGIVPATIILTIGGSGGNNIYGYGGALTSGTTQTGISASGYGGGAGGATGSGASGGNGSQGVVFITEYGA